MPPLRKALAIIVALILLAGGQTVAIIALSSAVSAGHEANNAVDCVNGVLGDRNGTSAKDAAAHIAFAESLEEVLNAVPGQEQTAAFKRFVATTETYVTVLRADQRYRDAHPLGKC